MKRYCLNCNTTDDLDKHGRCSHCGSDAVCLPESMKPFVVQRTREIEQLELLYRGEQ